MLVLTRKLGEKIVIGNGIVVTLVDVKGNRARIGIEAPDNVEILRGELACWRDSAAPAPAPQRPGREAEGDLLMSGR